MSRTRLLMWQTCLMILASLCLSAAARAQSSVVFRQFSYHEGKRYESKVTTETLEGSPVWTDGQENPPLPARRAVEIASAQLSKIVPDASKWGLQRILLQPIGAKWVYVVEFLESPPADNLPPDGRRDTFSVVVLMSGEAVEPTLMSPHAQNNPPKDK
jgi:hypothetical protein